MKNSEHHTIPVFEDGDIMTRSGWILAKQYATSMSNGTGYLGFERNRHVDKIRASLNADKKVQPTDNTIISSAEEIEAEEKDEDDDEDDPPKS